MNLTSIIVGGSVVKGPNILGKAMAIYEEMIISRTIAWCPDCDVVTISNLDMSKYGFAFMRALGEIGRQLPVSAIRLFRTQVPTITVKTAREFVRNCSDIGWIEFRD